MEKFPPPQRAAVVAPSVAARNYRRRDIGGCSRLCDCNNGAVENLGVYWSMYFAAIEIVRKYGWLECVRERVGWMGQLFVRDWLK